MSRVSGDPTAMRGYTARTLPPVDQVPPRATAARLALAAARLADGEGYLSRVVDPTESMRTVARDVKQIDAWVTTVADALARADGQWIYGNKYVPGDVDVPPLWTAEQAEREAAYLAEALETFLETHGDPMVGGSSSHLDELAEAWPELEAIFARMQAHAHDPAFVDALLRQLGGEGVGRTFALIDRLGMAEGHGHRGNDDLLERVDANAALDGFLALLAAGSHRPPGARAIRELIADAETNGFRVRAVTLLATGEGYASDVLADVAELLLVTTRDRPLMFDPMSMISTLHPDLEHDRHLVALRALAGDVVASADLLSRGVDHADAVLRPAAIHGWRFDDDVDVHAYASQVLLNALVNADGAGVPATQIRRSFDNIVLSVAENGIHDELRVVVAGGITVQMPALEDRLADRATLGGDPYREVFAAAVARLAGSPEAAALLVDGALESMLIHLGHGVDDFLDPSHHGSGTQNAFSAELDSNRVLQAVAAGILDARLSEEQERAVLQATISDIAGGASAIARAGRLVGPKGAIVGIASEQIIRIGSELLTDALLDDPPDKAAIVDELRATLPRRIGQHLWDHHPEMRAAGDPNAIGAGAVTFEEWFEDSQVQDVIRALARDSVGPVIDEVLITGVLR